MPLSTIKSKLCEKAHVSILTLTCLCNSFFNTKERPSVENLLVDKYVDPRPVYTDLMYNSGIFQRTFNQVSQKLIDSIIITAAMVGKITIAISMSFHVQC